MTEFVYEEENLEIEDVMKPWRELLEQIVQQNAQILKLLEKMASVPTWVRSAPNPEVKE